MFGAGFFVFAQKKLNRVRLIRDSCPRNQGAEIVSKIGEFAPEARGFSALPTATFVSTAEEALPDARIESAEDRTHERFATTERARLAWREFVKETALTFTFTRGARVTDTV
jgi:hypothetical protein